jgi:hypothetical protein
MYFGWNGLTDMRFFLLETPGTATAPYSRRTISPAIANVNSRQQRAL